MTSKLYDIPNNSKIVATIQEHGKEQRKATITFHHLDGMYSYCTIDDTNEVVHIGASAELELLDDGTYKLI